MGTDETNLMFYFEEGRPAFTDGTIVILSKDAIIERGGGIRAPLRLLCKKQGAFVYFFGTGNWHFKVPEDKTDLMRSHFQYLK